jgi:hypothetical protein
VLARFLFAVLQFLEGSALAVGRELFDVWCPETEARRRHPWWDVGAGEAGGDDGDVQTLVRPRHDGVKEGRGKVDAGWGCDIMESVQLRFRH